MSGCLDNFPLVAPFGLIKTIPSLLNACWSLQKAVKHHCSALWPWTTSTGVLLLWKTHVALSLLIHQECEWHMYVCLRGEHKLCRSQVCSHHLLKLQSCFWGQPRCRTTCTWDEWGVKPGGSGSHRSVQGQIQHTVQLKVSKLWWPRGFTEQRRKWINCAAASRLPGWYHPSVNCLLHHHMDKMLTLLTIQYKAVAVYCFRFKNSK